MVGERNTSFVACGKSRLCLSPTSTARLILAASLMAVGDHFWLHY